MLKVGSIVYATRQGLGILAKAFYDNGILTDVAIVHHGHRHTHTEWYSSQSPQITSISQLKEAQFRNDWLNHMDVMIFFETPFDWTLINHCRERGIKTVMIPMFECMPKQWPAMTDRIINPSALDQQYYPQGRFIPIPVSTPWRQRTVATSFIHHAGHGGLKGRNGTTELIEAMRLVKTPVRLSLTTQDQSIVGNKRLPANIDLDVSELEYSDLWAHGDVLVFPEKFNGLSLPLQEARAAGMLVMGTDRFPMNTWLPKEPLIPTSGLRTNQISGRCVAFDEALIDPAAIAAKIDEWYGRDITQYSIEGQHWAEENSWAALKPLYQEAIES